MQEPYRKGSSESILTSSLAGDIVRCHLKRRQRHWSDDQGRSAKAINRTADIQSHMHPTQSGKRMSQGRDGLRKAAKKSRQERVTALLHHLNIELLRESLYARQR